MSNVPQRVGRQLLGRVLPESFRWENRRFGAGLGHFPPFEDFPFLVQGFKQGGKSADGL
jgi:hypothetical protein